MNLENNSEIILEDMDEPVYIRDLGKILIKEDVPDYAKKTIRTAIKQFKQNEDLLRKQMEEEIQKERKQFMTAIDSLPHPFYVIDPSNFQIILMNSATTQLYSAKEDIYTCFSLTHGVSKPCSDVGEKCPLEEVKRTKKSVVVKHQHYDKEGYVKTFELHYHPIFDDEGNVHQVIEYSLDITERKEAEKQLQKNERRLKTVQRIAQMGYWEWDLSTNQFELSKEAKNIYQLNQNSVDVSVIMDMIHSDDRNKVQEAIDRTIKYHETTPVECRITTSRGVEKWVMADEHPVIGRSGVIEKIFGYIMDITERKQIENALMESEERLRSFMDSATDAFALLDSELNIVEVNQIALNMIGLERQEVINKYYGDFIPDFEGSEIFFNYKKVLKTGNPIIMEDYLPHHSTFGKKYYNMRIFRVGEGLGVIATDITEHKQADQALQKSEENLRQIIQNMPVMLDAFDENNKVLVWNRECERVTGYTEEEMIVSPNPLSNLYPDPVFFSKIMKEWAEKEDSFYNWEIDITHKDGTMKTVSWSNISKHFPIPGWKSWAVGVDITERKKMEEELLEKRKLAALGQMAAGLAHELNTPLANINLTTDYLLNLVNKRETQFKDNLLVINELNDIKQQANFCVQIVKDLLLFSRKIDISATSFNAKSFFSDITSLPIIGASINKMNVDVILEIHDDISIVGDQVLLSLCFQNIINNSIDAFSSFHDNPIVRISLVEHEKDIEVCITDNGEGIKEEHISKIFEPFFTTKKVGKGTGLGLSIARGIVEKHKGYVTVNTTLGEGTEVRVTIPKEID